MPALGADMVEGTLLEWQVHPGDEVHRGDIVAVIDTDKAAIEVECFEDGVVRELLVQPGTKVPVGTPLAVIDGSGVCVPEPVIENPLVRRRAAMKAEARRQPVAAPPVVAPAPARRKGVRASPFARRRATELGVDLATVAGTGRDGAITAADVEGTSTPAEHVAGDRSESMRRAIGELMARSKREVPHYYLSSTIDMTASMTWLRDTNSARTVSDRLVPAALLLKAAALACREVPQLNGYWEDELHIADHVNLGVAVSMRPSGLVAPAILDADTLDLLSLMRQLRELVTRARAGRLRSREMSDGTITVTNLGDNGAEAVFGVIYPPQVALVGLGRVVERPWATQGLLGVRPCVTATLSADHRATDGHDGSRYLAALNQLLQEPEKL